MHGDESRRLLICMGCAMGRRMKQGLLYNLVPGVLFGILYDAALSSNMEIYNSVTPSLVLFVVAYNVKLDIEALQHHVHRE
jgi:hypothetical protein